MTSLRWLTRQSDWRRVDSEESSGAAPHVTLARTVSEALKLGLEMLWPSASAGLDAQLLLGHVLDRPRAWVLAHGEEPVPRRLADEYFGLVERRRAGEPVAYLRGHVEWFGLELEVDRNVLVPRPETELLVEQALAMLKSRSAKSVADVGTGSGAIAVALALKRQDLRVFAIDQSNEALAVAARNVASHGVDARVKLLCGNLLEPLSSRPDMIVSNLPYLSDAMMESIGADVRHEPGLALRGGETGLELYRDLFTQMRQRDWLVPALVEIDPRHEMAARELVQEILPESSVEVLRDYAGHERVVVVLP